MACATHVMHEKSPYFLRVCSGVSNVTGGEGGHVLHHVMLHVV